MKYLGLFSFILLCSCTTNLYDELAKKDTPEAVFFEAKLQINKQDYDAAINLLQTLDASFLADRQRVPVHASAYAGRCGLVFLELLNSMQNTGSSTVLGTLMGAFNSATAADVADCIESERIMTDDIGDESVRDGDENLFMAFNSLAKIAAILSSLADTDDDDIADATFDQCDATDLPEVMVRQIGTGIGVALLSLAAVGTSYVDGAISGVQSLCDEDPNLSVFCTATDPASFSATEVQALRYAIGSNDFGINSCGNRDFSNCAAANPACP